MQTPSSFRTDRSFWLGWGIVLGAGMLLVGLALLPPFVEPELRVTVMQAFAPVCHQMPERSFQVSGVSLAVCHRCIGLYASIPLAAFAFLALWRWEQFLNQHARLVLAGAALPMAADWSAPWLGLWTNTPTSQVLTGGLFGLAAGLYLTRALVHWARPGKA